MKWRGMQDIERKAEKSKDWANNKGNRLRCIFCSTKIYLKHSNHINGGWPFVDLKTQYLKIKYVFKHISFYESSCMTADKNVKWPKIKWNESDHTGGRWPFRDFKRTE